MCRVRRFIAMLLLLAYAGTGTSVFPAVMLVLAQVDGSHLVVVTHSEQGTQVRLHHEEGNFTPKVEDHCSPVTRALVSCFSSAADGDHSLSTQGLGGALLLPPDERKHDVKDTPEVNLEATFQLVLEHQWPVASQAAPHEPAPVPSGSQLSAQRRAMGTVRLLI